MLLSWIMLRTWWSSFFRTKWSFRLILKTWLLIKNWDLKGWKFKLGTLSPIYYKDISECSINKETVFIMRKRKTCKGGNLWANRKLSKDRSSGRVISMIMKKDKRSSWTVKRSIFWRKLSKGMNFVMRSDTSSTRLNKRSY